MDNLYAAPIALSYFKLKNMVNPVVVSPDAGGVARAKNFLEGLSQQVMCIKNRPSTERNARLLQCARMALTGASAVVGAQAWHAHVTHFSHAYTCECHYQTPKTTALDLHVCAWLLPCL